MSGAYKYRPQYTQNTLGPEPSANTGGFRRRVSRVDQSPMNPLRWVLTLDCRHEVWVTAKKRPTRQMLVCDECKRKAAGSGE